MLKKVSKHKKIKILEKVVNTGIKSETDFISLTPADMIKSIPELTTDEFRILCDIQDSVRAGALFSFLCKESGDV